MLGFRLFVSGWRWEYFFGFAEKTPTSVAASPSDSDSGKQCLPKPCLHPRALHGARIREAQNMPQGLFCVRPRLARRRAGFSGVEARRRFNEFPEKLPRPYRTRVRFPLTAINKQ